MVPHQSPTSSSVRRWARTLLVLAATAGAASAAVHPALEPADGASLAQRIREQEIAGDARPKQAAEALQALLPRTAPFSEARVELLTVQGFLLNRAQPDALPGVIDQLNNWARTEGVPLRGDAAANARFLAARAAGARRSLGQAAALTSEALAGTSPDVRPVTRYRLLALLCRLQEATGNLQEAARSGLDAQQLADRLDEPDRRAGIRIQVGYVQIGSGQHEAAGRTLDEAIGIASRAGLPVLVARASHAKAALMAETGRPDAQGKLLRQAVEEARRGDARSDEGLYLANLSDWTTQSGRHDEALRLAERALPLLREEHDVGGEAAVLQMIGLSRIALGQLASGRRFVEEGLAIYARQGDKVSLSQGYLAWGQALEKARDMPGAFKAYSRHRDLADEIMDSEQQKAIIALQEQHANDRRGAELARLRTEAVMRTEQVRRQGLKGQLWTGVAVALLASLLALGLLLRRLRTVNRALASSNAQLKLQSESDALTGLSNRRHFSALMTQPRDAVESTTSLFLIDLDRFKQLNDDHGHAAGDGVLVEVADRLRAAARQGDTVARWGGEEFLVCAEGLDEAGATRLAQALLAAVGSRPVEHGGQAIAVTASIGFATMTLDPARGRAAWDEAIKRVDTALYQAKAQGRNRACGLAAA